MKNETFDEYYQSLIKNICAYIDKTCREQGIRTPKLSNTLRVAIREQLMRITIRTLILEMKLSNRCGELSGETDGELYRSFIERCILNKEWMKEFDASYPFLLNSVMTVIQSTENNLCEIIRCFYQDKDEINNLIRRCGEDLLGEIIEIDGGDSDVHCQGKRVYILELTDGRKVVYKPRSLAVDQSFGRFVQWVADGAGIDYPWGWYLDKGDYGWCEWISASSCESMGQLERYYERNGVLLAVAYLLGSSDIHYENLIAHGEYPIVVDLELGLGRRNAELLNKESAAEAVCRDSVLRTGLLPMFAWNQDGEGINVGAISAVGGQLAPIELPVIVNQGTVKMEIEYRRPRVKEGKNLAKLEDQFINPYTFVSQIEKGFEMAYRFILNNKDEAKRRINQMSCVSVRYLAKNTQEYTMLLGTSYHPSCICDEKERRNVLAHIRRESDKTPKELWVSEQEIDELMRGDIPYFRYCAGELDLYSGNGAVYRNFFEKTVVSEVMDRVGRLDEADLNQQKRLIRASLIMGNQGKGCHDRSTERHMMDDAKGEIEPLGLEVATRIGNLLLEDAIWGEDGKSVGWISMMLAGHQERGCLIRAMGPYFYDGLAGVALFFAALCRKIKNERFKAVKEILVNQLFQHTDAFVKDSNRCKRNSGAYTGEASIAYTYQLLYESEGDENYLSYMERQCEGVAQICESDRTYDVLGGNAGAVLVLLNAYDLTKNVRYLDWAVRAGDCLLRAAKISDKGMCWVNPVSGVALTGFAHGTSGIMLALAKLGKYSGEERFSTAAHQAYLFEQSHYEPEAQDWADLRYPKELRGQLGHQVAWCRGKGGILMARKAAKKYAGWNMEEDFADSIPERKPVKVRNKESGVKEFNLCHGRLGQAAIMAVMNEFERAEEQYRQVILELAGAGENLRDALGQQECENYGYMSGISGLGYASLRGIWEMCRILCVDLMAVR